MIYILGSYFLLIAVSTVYHQMGGISDSDMELISTMVTPHISILVGRAWYDTLSTEHTENCNKLGVKSLSIIISYVILFLGLLNLLAFSIIGSNDFKSYISLVNTLFVGGLEIIKNRLNE